MKNEEFEDDLKKLLDLYLKGRLPAREKARLEKQLEDLKRTDGIAHEFTQQDSDQLWKKITSQTVDRDHSHRRLWVWAAAILVFASGAVLLTLSWNHDRKELATRIILGDGTIVWLKPGAKLDHSQFSNDNRNVILSGEALFEVAKAREHPFTIHCGRYDAQVVGTSFNIKAGDSSVELTVLTGSVKLSSLRTDSSVLVNSNEHIVLKEGNKMLNKTSIGADELRSVIENTQYDMYFEDTRMSDVIRRVEKKFDVRIELSDPDIGNCMISADFTDQSLPITLTMISEALGFQYEIKGNDIMISGAGCQE